jgi:flagellar hook-basal body complex protein FliE
MLEGLVASANQSARFADGMSQAFAAGARDDIHGTMIAISKADIELHLLGTVRNKVIDAFYELWRMQI